MPYAHVNGHEVTNVELHVPPLGPWFADVTFERAPDVEGAVTLALGALELSGTIAVHFEGTRGLQRMSRIVAGAGGWGTLLPPKAYHNDARVKARTVAEDAAREAGETLGDFAPAEERVGIDYVRQSGPASRVLEDVIGARAWWVDMAGATHVGERESTEADPDAYTVLEYEPAARVVTLAVDDLTAVAIGSVLSADLDSPQTVRELTVRVTPDAVRVRAWTGAQTAGRGRLAGALQRIVARATDGRLHGLWRYRVVQMSGDRVELQAVRQRPGLPDVLPISMWPGVAGAHAELAGGAEVLVQFIEGDRTQPIVTHFAGKDGVGWVPANLLLDASTRIDLGAGAESFVALADAVKDELDAIEATLDTGTTPVGSGGGGGAVTFSTPYVAGDVAASKVRAE